MGVVYASIKEAWGIDDFDRKPPDNPYVVKDPIQNKANFKALKFNGDSEGNSLYTVLNVAFPPEVANEILLFNFDLEGISISGGSACSSGSNKGSHVIRALNNNLDYAPIRFSFGKYNTIEEAKIVLQYVGKLFENASIAQQ